jgi:catechol 2,3-dioxygenase-like lactoylglutathione lyase family enzyme
MPPRRRIEPMSTGEILGVHHIKIPVSHIVRSRAWYERVFDLEPFLEFADDPDGLQLRFYTLNEQGADPEGRVRA